MKIEDARVLLKDFNDDDGPLTPPASILTKLSVNDMPEGAAFQVGTLKDGVIHLEWNGTFRREGASVFGEADHTWTRKYWYDPVGLEQYLDLVRRAVELRSRIHGDVSLTNYDDDGAYVSLTFRIDTVETNLRQAYDEVRRIADEIEETARQAGDEIGQRLAEIAARLSGWGSQSLDVLVDAVGTAKTADEKGRSLEELCSRLFASVHGLTVTGRIRTETEEIDITILNDSNDPRLRREAALILIECKNWTGRCGKNEFVLFKEKLENRSRRSTLGFLVSWNGFTETFTKEMLRGSREDILIVPVTGEDIRTGVRNGNFARVLLDCWDNAILV
jgi:Restriction endonuclease